MEFNVEELIRKNILELEAYSCARTEYNGENVILLDANENPFDHEYSRYPDPGQEELKRCLAVLKGTEAEGILLGNGSDELIDMLIRTACEPGRDRVMLFSPGYSMYEVSARINGVMVDKLELDAAFMPDWEQIFQHIHASTRMIFFCSPNNPVGNVLPLQQVAEVADRFNGWVVVDEAYIDFTVRESATVLLKKHPNIVVLQTLSKAWGMAGLRIGICMADPRLIRYLNRVKPPYNIGSLVQREALNALRETARFRHEVETIRRERERMFKVFSALRFPLAVYPSEANFILLCCLEYRGLYAMLLRNGVVVRIRHIPPRLEGGLRITVGTPEQNDRLIALLYDWDKQEDMRDYGEMIN